MAAGFVVDSSFRVGLVQGPVRCTRTFPDVFPNESDSS